jgi:hypothetical protein
VIQSPGVPAFRGDCNRLAEPYQVAIDSAPAVNRTALGMGRRAPWERSDKARPGLDPALRYPNERRALLVRNGA